MFSRLNNESGIVSIAAVLVSLTVATVLATSVYLVGLSDLQAGFGSVQSEKAFALAEGCSQEALLRLSRSSSYAGGTLSVGSHSCTISVTGSGGTRAISVSATVGGNTRTILMDVSISGSTVSITNWSEDIT